MALSPRFGIQDRYSPSLSQQRSSVVEDVPAKGIQRAEKTHWIQVQSASICLNDASVSCRLRFSYGRHDTGFSRPLQLVSQMCVKPSYYLSAMLPRKLPPPTAGNLVLGSLALVSGCP